MIKYLLLFLMICTPAWGALQDDNFNDNSIDTSFWESFTYNSGTVNETNNQLEVQGANFGGRGGGLQTKVTHDLTTADFSVDVTLDNISEMDLFICLTKVTSSNPYDEDDWYRIIKNNGDNNYYVQKRKGGAAPSTLANGAWAASGGTLRITISGGTITFYENGNNRASESYDLSTYNAYVILHGRIITSFFGTDSFDNFLGSSGSESSTARLMVIE